MGRTGVVAALLDDAARTVRQVDTMTKAPAKRHNCEIRVANKNKHGNFTRTQDACGQRKANTRHSPHARAWTCAQHMSERGDNFHDDRMTHQPEDESAAPGGRAACGQALYGTWLCYVCVDEIPSDSAGASSQTAEELRTLRLHVSRKQTRATGVGCSCIGRARHRAHAVTRPSPGTSVQAGSKMAILTDGHVEKCLYCIRCLSTLESVGTTYCTQIVLATGTMLGTSHTPHTPHTPQGGHHHPDRTCDAFVGLKKPAREIKLHEKPQLHGVVATSPTGRRNGQQESHFPAEGGVLCGDGLKQSRNIGAAENGLANGRRVGKVTRQGQVGARVGPTYATGF